MQLAAPARRRREWITLIAVSVSFVFVGAIAFGFIA